MGVLSNISGREAVKVFEKIGYRLDRQEGSHMILYNKSSGYPILVSDNIRKGEIAHGATT